MGFSCGSPKEEAKNTSGPQGSRGTSIQVWERTWKQTAGKAADTLLGINDSIFDRHSSREPGGIEMVTGGILFLALLRWDLTGRSEHSFFSDLPSLFHTG